MESQIGHTNDLARRVEEHNRGENTFSKRYKPWMVLYNESLSSELEAIKRERYFKSAAGRRWMKKNLFNAEVVEW